MASLIRCDERVGAKGAQPLNRLGRVVARVGGHLPGHHPGVADSLLHHDHSLMLVRCLVGRLRRHYHLALAVYHRLAVVGLAGSPALPKRAEGRTFEISFPLPGSNHAKTKHQGQPVSQSDEARKTPKK